jgi:hypothetical protein
MNPNNNTNIKDKSFSSSSTSSSTSSKITVINSATSETNNNNNNNMNDKTNLLMNNKLNENFKSLKSSQKSINRQNSFFIDELLTVQVNATNKLIKADSMTTVIPNCNNDSLNNNNNNNNNVLSYEDKIPQSISTNFYGFDDVYDDYQDKLNTTRTNNNNNKFNNNNIIDNQQQQQQNSNKRKNLFVNEECSLKSSFNSVRYFNLIFLL